MFAKVVNHVYGYERLRHRGDRLFLAGEFERARSEYLRARSVLSQRDYRTPTIDGLIRECDAQSPDHGRVAEVPVYGPVREALVEPHTAPPFLPGLHDLFELAIGDKAPGRIGAYRAMNDEFRAGYVALVQANAHRAVGLLSNAAASLSSSFVAHLELGRAHSLAGTMSAARDALKHAERLAPEDTEVGILLSAVNIELGRHQDARDRLETVAGADPTNPDVSFLLGRSLAGLGRRDAALEKFRETVAFESNFHEAYFEASLLLGQDGDGESQFQLLSRACAIAPDEVRYNRELVSLVLSAESFDEEAGLAACDRLMVTDEDNAWQYLFWIAQLYVRRGWKREARDPLEKALRLVPPHKSTERREIEAFQFTIV